MLTKTIQDNVRMDLSGLYKCCSTHHKTTVTSCNKKCINQLTTKLVKKLILIKI